MKLITWNVNGLRACEKKGFADFFRAVDADFFCIQETKMQEDQLGQLNFKWDGYLAFWNSAEKKGYSGTAIFTKHTPLAVYKETPNAVISNEGRVITLEYPTFFLVNAYVPNSKPDLSRIPLREKWEDNLRAYLCLLNSRKPVLYCGDLNVAHESIDLKYPDRNIQTAGYTINERNKLNELLQSGFTDAFRYKYPGVREAYTWWSYMGNARVNNAGWRIDYWLVSDRIKQQIRDAIIHRNIYGSDHCPVELDLY